MTTIKKITYEDIENINADTQENVTHYIIDCENGNVEYYLDIPLWNYYIFNNKNKHDLKRCQEGWCDRGFFVYNDKSIKLFIEKYKYMFEDELIDNIFNAAEKCKKVHKQIILNNNLKNIRIAILSLQQIEKDISYTNKYIEKIKGCECEKIHITTHEKQKELKYLLNKLEKQQKVLL